MAPLCSNSYNLHNTLLIIKGLIETLPSPTGGRLGGTLCRVIKTLKRPKSPHFSPWSHLKDTYSRSKKTVLIFFRECGLVRNRFEVCTGFG